MKATSISSSDFERSGCLLGWNRSMNSIKVLLFNASNVWNCFWKAASMRQLRLWLTFPMMLVQSYPNYMD